MLENLRLAAAARRPRQLPAFWAASRACAAPLGPRARDGRRGRPGRPRSTRRPARLSYGEQRQLEVGIALATRPQLLLLDEPTAGMSPEETQRMTRLLVGLPREVTLLIIEHDMDVVFSLADRITVLHYGEVLAEGRSPR